MKRSFYTLLIFALLLLSANGCSSSYVKVVGFDGLNQVEASEKAVDNGYKNIKLLDSLTDSNISNVFKDASEEEMNNWIVHHATESETGSDERVLNLYFIYIGIIEMPDLVEMPLDEALDILNDFHCSNVNYASDNEKSIFWESNWTVVSQNIEAGQQIPANESISLTCHKYEDAAEDKLPDNSTPTIPSSSNSESQSGNAQDDNSTYYSTNDLETAKKGNSGVFAYRSTGGTYYRYWIIDFDEGYVYYFREGNEDSTCDRLKIESGDLNQYVLITYHDNGSTWSYGLHFKWRNQPDILIVQESDGYENSFSTTDLDEALAVRDTKTIIDY